MSALYEIKVGDQAKGQVFKATGRWRWVRPNNSGVETYRRGATLLEVRRHLSRLCNKPLVSVTLTKVPWPEHGQKAGAGTMGTPYDKRGNAAVDVGVPAVDCLCAGGGR